MLALLQLGELRSAERCLIFGHLSLDDVTKVLVCTVSNMHHHQANIELLCVVPEVVTMPSTTSWHALTASSCIETWLFT